MIQDGECPVIFVSFLSVFRYDQGVAVSDTDVL